MKGKIKRQKHRKERGKEGGREPERIIPLWYEPFRRDPQSAATLIAGDDAAAAAPAIAPSCSVTCFVGTKVVKVKAKAKGEYWVFGSKSLGRGEANK